MLQLSKQCAATVVMRNDLKSYSELITFQSFDERLDYLRMNGTIGEDTFGFDRVFNQKFYASYEWKRARNSAIARDLGCDMGLNDFPIIGKVLVHHINPITIKDLEESAYKLFDINNLITVSQNTHNLIHYGINRQDDIWNPREKGDTCPWTIKST